LQVIISSIVGLRQAIGGCDKPLGIVAVDRRDQRVPGGEMAVQRLRPDTGAPRYLIEAGADPFSAKAAFAVSSKRTRLRSASTRGLRTSAGSHADSMP
jgi:hypothetical protein